MPGQARIRLSSAVSVDLGGRTLAGRHLGSRKARRLLALLAAERGRLVPIDRIVDVVWPEGPPTDPAANVSTLISRLRRQLGEGVVTTAGRAYGLVVRAAWSVDLDEAEALASEADARLSAGEHALAAAGARRALAVLGDQPALVDEPDADWVDAVRREADGLRRRSRHLLAVALTVTSPASAAEVAADAVTADLFDEQAVRDLMRALTVAGRPSAALEAYDNLVQTLRRELGTDPASATADLHVAILRDALGPADAARRPPSRPSLVGRDSELAALERAWGAAGAGEGALLLVEGEGGIGKTGLLEAAAQVAENTGGLVLRGRCHPSERSLFLEPYIEALRPAILDQRESVLTELVRDHEPAWLGLLPELSLAVPTAVVTEGPAELQRRRAYDAIAIVLRRLSRERPVLLAIDDLQDGGSATVDLLGYLARRLGTAKVLLLAAVRSEHLDKVAPLLDRGDLLHLDLLPRSAVDALASAAGLASHGAAVMERTSGHPLSVMETLRALAAGDEGLPTTLAEAVLTRVERLDPPARETLRAASVIRRRLEPRLLAELTESSELSVVTRCEALAKARLLTRSDRHYEFANDLLQECVYSSLSPAVAAAYHRRAADLTSARPEVMAEHAFAAGELDRAAQGWLLAGEAAMRRSALDDAAALFGRALAATTDPSLRARLLIARSLTREALTTYADALADIDEALELARGSRDRRLHMMALRARGGDVPIGLNLPTADVSAHLEAALSIASELGDRRAEADVSARLSVLDVSRLRFSTAIERAETTLRRVGTHEPSTRTLALDGLKTALAYLGDARRLQEVIDELEPELRRRETSWLLQWVVFESAFVPAAHSRWDECRARVAEAVDLNRHTGYTAYAGFFEAHLGWFERLAGDLDAAVRHGRRAVDMTSVAEHPWWYAAACGQLAATLIEAGLLADAEETTRRGLSATGPGTAEAWQLRCAAPLAAVSDDDADWARALELLRGVEVPDGHAWVAGADCYLLVARAALRRGAIREVEKPLRDLRQATTTSWTPVRREVDELLSQMSSATS